MSHDMKDELDLELKSELVKVEARRTFKFWIHISKILFKVLTVDVFDLI